MNSRYTVLIKQPGMDRRELCGALYLRWAKDAAEDHARYQPWDSVEYRIRSNRTGCEWVGQVEGKQVKWSEPL